MCLAIAHFSDADPIDMETFRRIRKRHDDGHSIMWAEDEKIKTWKSLSRLDLFYQKYYELREQERDMVIHFRRATRGAVSLDNCHPFFVDENLAFVHNGTINIPDLPKGKSDTLEFRDRILRNLPDRWYENIDLRDMVNAYSGWSRFVFLTNEGTIYLINEGKGEWNNGTWFSNSSYKDYEKTRKPYNSKYITGNKDKDDDDSHSEGPERVVDDVSVENYGNTMVSGWFFQGHAMCDTCLPTHAEDSDHTYDINMYYDAKEDYDLEECHSCGHIIWPLEILESWAEFDQKVG